MTKEQLATLRQKRYTAAAVVSLAGPALAVALAEGGVSKWVAVAIAVGTALTGSVGSAGAARATKGQIADGHFAEPAPVSAAEQVANGMAAWVAETAQHAADGQTVAEAIGQAPAIIATAGSLAEQSIAVAVGRR